MSKPNDHDLERTITGNIHLSVGGLYSHSLRRQIVESALRQDLEDLPTALLSAQRDGLIDFRKRRWCQPYHEALNTEQDQEMDSQRVRLSNAGKLLKAIPATVLAGALQKNEGPALKPAEPISEHSLEAFKALGQHYIECLRLGAAARASIAADKHTQQFQILKIRARWWPDDAGSRLIRIARSDLGSEFLKGLAKRSREPVLIGYPLSVGYIPSDDLSIVSPMAILQCDFRLDDGALILQPISAVPVLNPDWVGKRSIRREFRTTLRRLADLTEQDDGEISLAGREGWGDLDQMIGLVRSLLPDHCAHDLDSSNSNGALNLQVQDQLQNCIGLFLISENNFTKGSQADIRTLIETEENELSKTALAAFFLDKGHAHSSQPVAAPFDLSEDQYLAVRGGLSESVTVISGPPGTGKSQVVAAILNSAAMNGQTALFSSHTHKAIEAVQSRMDALTPDRVFLMRAGGSTDTDSVDFSSAIDALIAKLKDGQDKHVHHNNMAEIKSITDKIDLILRLADELSGLTGTLGEITAEGIERQNRLERSYETVETHKSGWVKQRLRKLLKLIARFFGQVDAVSKDGDGGLLPNVSDNALRLLAQKTELKHRAAVKRLEDRGAPDDLAKELISLKKCSLSALEEFLNTLEISTPEHRQRLTELRGAMGLATTRELKQEVWKVYSDAVVAHFPIWSGTALSVPTRIPLIPALFDYVIIDEATTCNLAQAIPLLARARHAIIVGDKMQTGMVSGLDPGKEREMLADVGLGGFPFAKYSFSQVSLFDFANGLPHANRHILRDHFRCDPEIADFVSQTFYEGRLMVRTDVSALRPPKGTRSGMHWTNISGPITSAGKGCRSESEAIAISDHIVSLIRDQNYEGSIGVVTPFQKQAQLIAIELERKLTFEERTRTSLVVGTSHKFQGDDRDLVVVSLCFGPGMPRGSYWFLKENTDWLNVAISRARAVCHIFGNSEACEQSSIRHISRLAKWIGRDREDPLSRQPEFESPWEKNLFDALAKSGIKAVTQYPLAGRRLDLAVFEGGLKLDIEVDGDTYHRDRDGFRKVSDYWRDFVVSSLGWKVRRFWVYDLREDMEKCVERVRRDISGE